MAWFKSSSYNPAPAYKNRCLIRSTWIDAQGRGEDLRDSDSIVHTYHYWRQIFNVAQMIHLYTSRTLQMCDDLIIPHIFLPLNIENLILKKEEKE